MLLLYYFVRSSKESCRLELTLNRLIESGVASRKSWLEVFDDAKESVRAARDGIRIEMKR